MPHSYDDFLERNTYKLDITPTMFAEATDHYKAVASLLGQNGVPASFYADGSFATGTVVRPYSEDEDAFFDLDVVGKRVDVEMSEVTPGEIRSGFEDVLASSDRYAPMLESYDECLTIRYASGSRDGFKLDIVPSVSTGSLGPGDPIAIACKNPERWLPSNPRGLAEWFNGINARFAAVSSVASRRKLWERHRDVYGSVEEVPDDMLRTSLQRTVQVLKRSRDVFYHDARIDSTIPSCAIMVLAATIAEELDPMIGISECIRSVIDRLELEVEAGFGGAKGLMGRAGDWHVVDPVSGGRLVEWSDGDMIALLRWLRALRSFLSADSVADMAKFNASMRGIFGTKAEVADCRIGPASVITSPTRPWAC